MDLGSQLGKVTGPDPEIRPSLVHLWATSSSRILNSVPQLQQTLVAPASSAGRCSIHDHAMVSISCRGHSGALDRQAAGRHHRHFKDP